jgi:hypothetical protein
MPSDPEIPRLTVEQVKRDLVVILHNERTFDARVEQAKKDGHTVTAHWRLGGMLGVLVVECGEQLIWADEQVIASAKLDGDAADLAVQNLRRKTQTPLLTRRLHPDHAVFIVGEDDGLASGRVILHDLFAPLAKLVDEAFGATLLVRVIQTGLVVCCPNTPGDMAFVEELISHGAKEPSFVGGEWLAWVHNAWAEIEIEE